MPSREVLAPLQHRDRVDDVRSALPPFGAEKRLRRRERERRLLRDRGGPLLRPREVLACRDDLVDEARRERLLRVERRRR